MTVFPELQDELVRAARRRHGRAPRTWRIVRPVLAAAAIAAIVAAVVLLAGRGGPSDERPAPARPSPAPTYGVLERPATPADDFTDVRGFDDLHDGDDIDLSRARLAARSGPLRVFLAPAPLDGFSALCTVVLADGRARNGGCAVTDRPIATWTGPGVPKTFVDGVQAFLVPASGGLPGAVVATVPDGIDAVTVRFRDGTRERMPVRDNVALYTPLAGRPLALDWTGTDGARHSNDLRLGKVP